MNEGTLSQVFSYGHGQGGAKKRGPLSTKFSACPTLLPEFGSNLCISFEVMHLLPLTRCTSSEDMKLHIVRCDPKIIKELAPEVNQRKFNILKKILQAFYS